MSQLVRIEDHTHEQLRILAEQTHESMGTLLSKALALYEEHMFWRAVHNGFGAARANPPVWAEELAERKAWECTLMDGLKDEEPYPVGEDGYPIPITR